MSKTADIVFYVFVVVGFTWSIVEFASKLPFDAVILALVTYLMSVYRNPLKEGK